MYNACYGGQACSKGDGSGSLTKSDVVATDFFRNRIPYRITSKYTDAFIAF